MIYVDDMLAARSVPAGRQRVWGSWSHLVADQPGLLRWAGARLGLQRSWLRFPGTPREHFLVTAGIRLSALEDGAVSIGWRAETMEFFRAKRAGRGFDLELLRSDPARFARSIAVPVVPAGGPRRVQLVRRSVVMVAAGSVMVAAPTRWANPYRPAGRSVAAYQAAVEHFIGYLGRNPALIEEARHQLRGRDLACWCAPHLPCHADVWLAVANGAPLAPTPSRQGGQP